MAIKRVTYLHDVTINRDTILMVDKMEGEKKVKEETKKGKVITVKRWRLIVKRMETIRMETTIQTESIFLKMLRKWQRAR